ncbi:uncharacterized protein LOC125493769 [Beta vulgaris subsp. vulgaris]|uniref:uncharacterized protein LOC125493769 n=1 Tax=Beta vulgaris subsp. vulgaris TaxID=3555 RepID=UPI002548CED9|nr:uncharacterized protein LOC125493769 [Beta vulgaris subsp. vulgaris]
MNSSNIGQMPGRLGASGLQKCTTAIRLLAYDTSFDSVDNHLRISASLARDSLQLFVEGVVSHFSDEYLRQPTEIDYYLQLNNGDHLMGCIDCMHLQWKNSPTQYKGMYSGRPGKPTLILEAITSYDLWIWHAFLGTPGRAPPVNYVVNDNQYDMGYYLTDGIYPRWAAFIPRINLPRNQKKSLFAQCQEGLREDVERAFGVLQARFAIVHQSALAHDREMLGKIIIACIIIHNMIVEDERDSYSRHYDPNDYEEPPRPSSCHQNTPNVDEPFRYKTSENRIANLQTYMTNRVRVRDNPMHDHSSQT